MIDSRNMQSFVAAAMESLEQQQEKILLEQLGDLVKRKLLVVERSERMVFQDPMSSELKLAYAVKLTLKDREYIESLEAENKVLKDRIGTIESYFNAGKKP